jgi:hypothetical protein
LNRMLHILVTAAFTMDDCLRDKKK